MKHILCTTALAFTLASAGLLGPALAQDQTTDPLAGTDPAESTAPDSIVDGDSETMNEAAALEPVAPDAAQKMPAEELVGLTVYTRDEENVGEIGEVIMGEDGMIEDVVIEVGGFLGFGEKPVRVGFEQMEVMQTPDKSQTRLYVKTDRETLEALPEHSAG